MVGNQVPDRVGAGVVWRRVGTLASPFEELLASPLEELASPLEELASPLEEELLCPRF
jgi:hypothetical protein